MGESRVFRAMMQENLPFGEIVACIRGDITRRSRWACDEGRFLKKYHIKLYHRQTSHSNMNTEIRAAVGFYEKSSGNSTTTIYL
jgi:hypothetical protein